MDPDPRWEAFAAREPYFAVLTDPRFLRANLTPEHEREFFASGEAVVSWMRAVIDAGLAPEFAPMSTLEYGCGIGRLALPLARRPGSVTAVDRSRVMLDLARREADRRCLGHIEFQSTDEFWAGERNFDLIVCYHVLQRLSREDSLDLIRRLAARLGPGGVAVFQWPYRSRVPAWMAASRWAREWMPGINAAANLLRKKPAGDPFIPTHTFEIVDVLPLFDDPSFRAAHVALEHHEGLDYAVAFVQRREAHPSPDASPRVVESEGRSPSDDDDDDHAIDEYNRAADAYFSSLRDWDHHLAKPFAQIQETPALLMGAAVLLQALRLTSGMSVLEFGAGSGWLSRFLTQMGCRVVLLDVSPTALRIAREHYARMPVIGDQPAAQFLEFDGRRIGLSDASVDRIVCFDAFHHAANPRAMIREFSRVLKPGGIAAFAEPGPRHAGAPRSQFESHTYGVVERDVDVHDIWRTAQACGFSELRMCVFHEPPYHVSLREYEDLIAGGAAEGPWIASTRKFLRHVRSFYLLKEGVERADSRTAAGLACDVRATVAATLVQGKPVLVDAIVANTGTAWWLPSDAPLGGVSLGAHLYDETGTLAAFDFHVEPLADPPREIAPGETVRRRAVLPALAAGRYRLELDCVAARVTWFAQAGSRPATLSIEVPASPP